jgi:integrase
MRAKLTEYHLNYKCNENAKYFFRTTNGMQVSYKTFETLYRKTLALAGIPKKDNCRYKYPRIHDLRHTFAVHSLAKMVSSGYDTYTSLPLLSKVLGHKHITETEYYLRFTEENYDTVQTLTNNIYQGVFPKVAHDN